MKKPTLIDRAVQHFKAAVHQAASEEAAAAVLDYSPELDPLLFDDLIAETSKLNLTTMAHVLEAHYKSLPSLIHLANRLPRDEMPLSHLMAIAFETGRRYSIIKMHVLIQEEIDTLQTAPPEPASCTRLVN